MLFQTFFVLVWGNVRLLQLGVCCSGLFSFLSEVPYVCFVSAYVVPDDGEIGLGKRTPRGWCLLGACPVFVNVQRGKPARLAGSHAAGPSRPKLGGLVAEFAAHSVQCGLGIMQTRL